MSDLDGDRKLDDVNLLIGDAYGVNEWYRSFDVQLISRHMSQIRTRRPVRTHARMHTLTRVG